MMKGSQSRGRKTLDAKTPEFQRRDETETVTLIIPTKGRPADLELAVQSVLRQSIRAHQLIIVDQSANHESRCLVEQQWARARADLGGAMKLSYFHDPAISGLAMARNRAIEAAEGQVLLFLDDDVYLEADFLEQVMAVYARDPRVAGVSGIITNYSPGPLVFRCWNAIFVWGPFYDERQPIYWRADHLRDSQPIPVRRFGGGLMSFRAKYIDGLRFDEKLHGVCDGEDVDFCARLQNTNAPLVIAPRARLIHKQSPLGRLPDHWTRRDSRAARYLFNKHWNRGFKNRLCFFWLVVGYAGAASMASLRRRSMEPWRSLITGLREGKLAAS
jgi:GT2 family glycosyltransferase